jgi:flagellar basal-body rod protein FlgC
MDYSSGFQISAAGMALERARVDATALNLANMHVARAADGNLYQPLRAVAVSGALPSFAQRFADAKGQALLLAPQEVRLEPSDAAPRLVHEPGHPQADARGFVAYPGVNHAAEMVNLVSALRAYEANVVAMNATKVMALKALEIGGNS